MKVSDYFAELFVPSRLADAGRNVYFPHRDEGFAEIGLHESLRSEVQRSLRGAEEARVTKKDREHWFAERFVKRCRPDLALDPGDSESPDFLAKDGDGRSVGLEITVLMEQKQTQTDAIAARIEQTLHQKRLAMVASHPSSIVGTISVVGVPRELGKQELYWPNPGDHDAFCG